MNITTGFKLSIGVIALPIMLALLARPATASCGGTTTVSNETELNAAIAAFNAVAASPCTFTIQLSGNIPLTASTTAINNATSGVNLVIGGATFTVDGQGINGILPFEIAADTVVEMNDITIRGGNSSSLGGGISNFGQLTINDSTITDNKAASHGGGINNGRNLVLGTLTVNNSTISNNTAGTDGNTSHGGGIKNWWGSVVTINNSTISGNTSDYDGAIGFEDGGFGGTQMWINNSTISGNTATADRGGIYVNGGTVTIDSSTITNNAGPGLNATNSATVTVQNSIIAHQATGNDCFIDSGVSFTSNGYNISGDATCGFTGTGDQENVSAAALNLGPLLNYGGATQTHALLAGSAAIDAGDTSLTTDQRGITRPQGAADDVGAFEFVCLSNPWSAGTEAELNLAIVCFDSATSAGTYTILLTADINLTASTFPISNIVAGVKLAINGGGFTVDGQGTSGIRPFEIGADTDVTMNQITITGGNVIDSGGGMLNQGTLTLNESTVSGNQSQQFGGGIYNNSGTLTVNNSTISGNDAVNDGGGLYNNLGSATFVNSTISGNSAQGTGGVGGGGGMFSVGATLALQSTTIASNSAPAGSGVYGFLFGSIDISNSILANSTGVGADCDLGGGASVTDGGYNLVETPGTCAASLIGTGDIFGQDPLLGPLADNGGSTQTHALLAGSPAIDAGNTNLTTDQRGIARPQGAADDIGAYESAATVDFGDLPDTTGGTGAGDYQTLLANDGPRHTITSLYMGTAVDSEADGQPNGTATGDDIAGATPDDEDGVTFPTFTAGQTATVVVNSSATGRVNAFFDWNNDGDFADADEEIAELPVNAGNNDLSVPVPAGAVTGTPVGARFRISTAGGLTALGAAPDGEVEDYLITVSNPTLATVGDFGVKLTSVDGVLSALTGKDGDTAALLALLASWDPELAASLKDADAATLAAALRRYLDPDGDGNVALVRWDTLQEHGTIGFHAERTQGNGWTRLNGGLLPGLIDAPQGGEYWLFDPDVTAGTYHYRLVELEAWGSERLHGPWEIQIGAAVSKLAQTVAPSTADEENTETAETTETTEFWSDWHGLAQGFAARKRVPPPPATQTLMAKAATVTTPTGALWLRTQTEGLYRVPTTQLAALLGEQDDQIRAWLSKGKKLALVNDGAPVPWHYDAASDALYFVAQTYHTLYTDENAYHVMKDKAQSLTMSQRTGAGPVAGSPVGTFRDTLRLEQDLLYAISAVTDDTEADYWFWGYLQPGTLDHDALTVSLTLPGAASTGQGQLRVYLRGWTDFEQGNDHRVSAALNGTALGVLEWDGFSTAVLTVPFDQALLAKGDSLTMFSEKISTAVTKTPPVQWLDRIEVDYWREPKAENGQLWLHGLAAGTHTVTGFASDAIHVIEAPATAQALWRRDLTIAPNGTGWQVSFDAPQGGDFLVAENQATSTPTAEIDATSTLAKASNQADYLIVAPRALAQTADALASYRTGRKSKVKIAWLDDIYDEFSAGRTDPSAISDFLAYVHRNWKRVPEYVVLLGNGTLDHKNRQGYDDSLLPVRMMMSPWGLLVSDNRYTDIDGDGRSEYAFGRIPATTDAQGLAYVDKVRAAAPPPSNAVVVADNPDSGGDFHASADRQAKELADLRLSVTKLYHPTNAVRAALTNSTTWEATYLSYDGHGSAKRLGNETFLKPSDVPALNNRSTPVFAALSCDVGNGALPGWNGSLAGALVLNPNGGAITAFAPTGISLDSDAQVIGLGFADYLIGGHLSAGQAAREAQIQSASRVTPFMLGVYQILGDPAVSVP